MIGHDVGHVDVSNCSVVESLVSEVEEDSLLNFTHSVGLNVSLESPNLSDNVSASLEVTLLKTLIILVVILLVFVMCVIVLLIFLVLELDHRNV